jgi:hypothetical protein
MHATFATGSALRARIALFALAFAVAGVGGSAHAGTQQYVVSATGQLAVLNGIGTLDLHAVAPPLPLGIPAPAGVATLVLQSTFDPPGPIVATIQLFCSQVVSGSNGNEYFGSGPSNVGPYYVHLAPNGPLGLWQAGFSTTPTNGVCGAGTPANIPIIGVAAILPPTVGY